MVFFGEENKLRVLSEKVGGERVPWYIFEIWSEGSVVYHKIVGYYGRNRQKDIEEAMHDLTKYNRQEWKYLRNRTQPTYNAIPSAISPEFSFPEFRPKEVKDYYPTKNIEQRNWRTPTEFPMCPVGLPENPLEAYKQNMIIDGIFSRNRYGESLLKDVDYTPERDALIVLTYQPGSTKEWCLCATYVDNGKFIHESISSYFQEDGGRKYFTIYTGGVWTGGEVFDDGC